MSNCRLDITARLVSHDSASHLCQSFKNCLTNFNKDFGKSMIELSHKTSQIYTKERFAAIVGNIILIHLAILHGLAEYLST